MSASAPRKLDASEETGVADVRLVRGKIAAQHNGHLREHVEETNRIVEPLIQKLGLKKSVPPQKGERDSGTGG